MPSASDTASQLAPERLGFAAPPELAARRAGLTAAVEAGLFSTDPPPQSLTIAGIRSLCFVPADKSRGTLLHIHGGAFRIGSPETVAPFAAALAARCAVSVICPAYRLAPEHPFPAGLNDAWAVLRALPRQGDQPTLLSGDSAGGAIAAGLAALAAGAGVPIAGLALLSPWLDLTVGNASYEQNAARDPLFSATAAHEAAGLYLQGIDPHDPLASPMFGAVEGLPPTYLAVGAGEVLRDDSLSFCDKLRAAGIPVTLDTVEGMDHVAVTRDLTLPGAAQTFAALAAFVEERLASD